MFYNANLYKVGLMNSQRHGGQRSTSVTFSTPEIPGADFGQINWEFPNITLKLVTFYKNITTYLHRFTNRVWFN